MIVTSSEANKILRQLEDEKNKIIGDISLKSTFLAATTEDVESVRPEFSFDDSRDKWEKLDSKIRAIKHAINIFNINTKVDEVDMTIDQILVYLPQLNQYKNLLNSLSTKMPKMRRNERYSSSSIIEYSYINYDLDIIKEEYERISALIAKIQTALDKVNSVKTFEIDY